MTLSSFALRSSAVRVSLVSVQVLVLGAALVACGDDPPARVDSGTDVDSGTVTPLPDGGDGGSVIPGDAGDGGTTGRMCTSPGGACDVIRQDCPSPQGCFYVATMAGGTPMTMCLEAGTRGDGIRCDFVNECLPGFTCNDGLCRHYCCMGSSSDCPAGTGQQCVGLVGSDAIGQCTQAVNCDLVTNEMCAEGRGCYPFSSDGTLGCFSAGTATEGAPCVGLNGCMPGMGCFGRDGGANACIRFCRVSMMDADCGGGGRMCASAGGLSLPDDFGLCPDPA
ncbi:MAG: hypothetical protein M3Y87_04260 [Myxococcota bacterium]|nr:hypothetical protein [Myxococcota bacterium]